MSSRKEVGSSSNQNRRRTKSLPKKPIRFCIIVLEDSVRQKTLKLVPEFVSKYGHELSADVTFKVPYDSYFRVGLTKRNGNIWFDKGCKEFMDRYLICYGHFLFFQYQGDSTFWVNIFDKSTTEIRYPSLLSSRHSVEDDISMDTKKKKKKMATNLAGHRGYRRVRLELSEECKKAIDAANKLKLKNPGFMIILKKSDLHKNAMHVPASFANNHLVGVDTIRALASDGREWTLCVRRENGLLLSRGCSGFKNDNKLSEGDVCVFELVDKMDHTFKVNNLLRIFRLQLEGKCR